MDTWFTRHQTAADRRPEDELPGRPNALAAAGPACCCPARPAVTAIMPPAPGRPHWVDLLLCGHHYQVSRAALRAAGAAVYDREGMLVLGGGIPGQRQAPREPAGAERR